MNEEVYPIYRFWAAFSDGDHDISGSAMFKKKLSFETGSEELGEFVESSLDLVRAGPDGEYTIRSLDLEVLEVGWKFLREETWCGGWFQHYTLNTHLTDEELLESFGLYIQRHIVEQPREHEGTSEHRERVGDDYICLMGAQDRWRWEDPCRCEHCQARGVVTIDH